MEIMAFGFFWGEGFRGIWGNWGKRPSKGTKKHQFLLKFDEKTLIYTNFRSILMRRRKFSQIFIRNY